MVVQIGDDGVFVVVVKDCVIVFVGVQIQFVVKIVVCVQIDFIVVVVCGGGYGVVVKVCIDQIVICVGVDQIVVVFGQNVVIVSCVVQYVVFVIVFDYGIGVQMWIVVIVFGWMCVIIVGYE